MIRNSEKSSILQKENLNGKYTFIYYNLFIISKINEEYLSHINTKEAIQM